MAKTRKFRRELDCSRSPPTCFIGMESGPWGDMGGSALNALAEYDHRFIAPGDLRVTNLNQSAADNLFAWDGTTWTTLGLNASRWVYALAAPDSTLVVGGSQLTAGGKVSAYLAEYSRTPGPVWLTGDVNRSGQITSSDIITLVNFVFKGGLVPLPCEAAGDVDCSGAVTSSDIIRTVNFVFKGGAPACDVNTIIPSVWSCP